MPSASQNLDNRLGFVVLDIGVQAVFIVELYLKLHLLGWEYFTDAWNILDYHLVVAGLADVFF